MQRWLVVNKLKLIRIWYTLLGGWLVFFLISLKTLGIGEWTWWGRQSATAALIFFWLTLIPGILKRFQLGGRLIPIRTLMVLYRRQMGITMYVFALTHLLWSRFLSIFKIGGNIWLFSPFEIIGLSAFILLTPVFITSNDWSVRMLGRWWRTLHALVYIVIWLLFLHLALQSNLGWKTFITLIMAALELFSLIWHKVSSPPVSPT